MTNGSSVGTVGAEHKSRAIAVITTAFIADPIARWHFQDPQEYIEFFPEFVGLFGGRAFDHGTAYQVGDAFGAALWLPPGTGPDEEQLGTFLERTCSEESLARLNALFEQMGSFHPAEEHWYLPLIGVDPIHHGRGLGSMLMAPVVAACDRHGTLAYLESTNPKNVPFYERHGFVVLGEIQVGDSPPMLPMLRRPR